MRGAIIRPRCVLDGELLLVAEELVLRVEMLFGFAARECGIRGHSESEAVRATASDRRESEGDVMVTAASHKYPPDMEGFVPSRCALAMNLP